MGAHRGLICPIGGFPFHKEFGLLRKTKKNQCCYIQFNTDQVKCHWLCSYLQKLLQMTLLNNTLLFMPFWYLLCGGIFHQIRFFSSSQNSNVCFVEAPWPHCTSCHLTLAPLLTRTSQFAFLSLFLSLYQ